MPKSPVSANDFIAKWPAPVVARVEAWNATGGLISSKQLANLDSEGAGPPEAVRLGGEGRGKIAYPAVSFFRWLVEQLQAVERKSKPSAGDALVNSGRAGEGGGNV